MKFARIYGTVSLLALSLHTNAGLVIGGDFESPTVPAQNYMLDVTPFGWMGTGDLVRQGYAGAVNSGNGNQWFDLNPNVNAGTGILQSILLDAGKSYEFSFLYNGGGGGSTNQISFNLSSGNESLFSNAVSTAHMNVYGGTQWNTYSTIFAAPSSGLYTLSFLPNGSWSGGFIDNVDISPVPLPATAWLFGTSMLGLAGIKRKK